jgi:hypothetical protein
LPALASLSLIAGVEKIKCGSGAAADQARLL